MNINTAIVTINRAGYIQSVDKGCCRMFGYEVLELQSQKINILIPTPYKEQHDSYLENYHRTGKPRVRAPPLARCAASVTTFSMRELCVWACSCFRVPLAELPFNGVCLLVCVCS